MILGLAKRSIAYISCRFTQRGSAKWMKIEKFVWKTKKKQEERKNEIRLKKYMNVFNVCEENLDNARRFLLIYLFFSTFLFQKKEKERKKQYLLCFFLWHDFHTASYIYIYIYVCYADIFFFVCLFCFSSPSCFGEKSCCLVNVWTGEETKVNGKKKKNRSNEKITIK